MQALPAIDITEKTDCFNACPNPFTKFPYLKNIILRTMMVVATGLLAMIVPKFGLFINLTGAFACTALAFILPVVMYTKVFKDELSTLKKYFHYFVVVFGTLCGGVSFIISFI